MADLSYQDALATAGAIAAQFLEVRDPAELTIVERHLSSPVVALALLMVDCDPAFGAEWTAAGDDWTKRGDVLREVILYILRPEGPVQ